MYARSSPINIKLDGTYYRIWSKILEMCIARRKRKGYIVERISAPREDLTYDEWEEDNTLVKS